MWHLISELNPFCPITVKLPPLMKTFSFLTLATCLSLVFSAPVYASKLATETLTVIQAQPTITNIDVGAPGGSHGDMLAFKAPFTTENGAKGVISGIITVALPDGVGGEHFRSNGCVCAPDHREDGTGIKVAGFFLNVGQVLGLKFFGRF